MLGFCKTSGNVYQVTEFSRFKLESLKKTYDFSNPTALGFRHGLGVSLTLFFGMRWNCPPSESASGLGGVGGWPFGYCHRPLQT